MKDKTEISLDKLSKQDIIKLLNKVYQESLSTILLDIYHRLYHNILFLEDIEDIGKTYNINIQEEYLNTVSKLEEDEDYV